MSWSNAALAVEAEAQKEEEAKAEKVSKPKKPRAKKAPAKAATASAGPCAEQVKEPSDDTVCAPKKEKLVRAPKKATPVKGAASSKDSKCPREWEVENMQFHADRCASLDTLLENPDLFELYVASGAGLSELRVQWEKAKRLCESYAQGRVDVEAPLYREMKQAHDTMSGLLPSLESRIAERRSKLYELKAAAQMRMAKGAKMDAKAAARDKLINEMKDDEAHGRYSRLI